MKKILKETLKEIIIFHALFDNELDMLVDKITTKEYQPGENICQEGEIGKELFLIISGKVAVFKKDENGKEFQLTTLKDKDCFGEMTLIDVQKRSASVRAIEKTIASELRYKALLEIYEESIETYSKIILNIAREFSRRLRSMDAKLVEFMQLCPEARKKG